RLDKFFSTRSVFFFIGQNMDAICTFIQNSGLATALEAILETCKRTHVLKREGRVPGWAVEKYREYGRAADGRRQFSAGVKIAGLEESDRERIRETLGSIGRKYSDVAVTRARHDRMEHILEKFLSLVGVFEERVSTFKTSEELEGYTSSTVFRRMCSDVFKMMVDHPRKREIVLHLAHIVLLSVYESKKTFLFVLLVRLLDLSEAALHEVSLWLSSVDDERKTEQDVSVAVLFFGFVDLVEYDTSLAEYIRRNPNEKTLLFAAGLVETFVLSRSPALSIYDFFHTVDALFSAGKKDGPVKTVLQGISSRLQRESQTGMSRRNILEYILREAVRVEAHKDRAAVERINQQLHKTGFFATEEAFDALVVAALEFSFQSLHRQINSTKRTSLRGQYAVCSVFSEAAFYVEQSGSAVSPGTAVLIFLSRIAARIVEELEKRYSSANLYGLILDIFLKQFMERVGILRGRRDALKAVVDVLDEISPLRFPSFAAVWVEVGLSPAVLGGFIQGAVEEQQMGVRHLGTALRFVTEGCVRSSDAIYRGVMRTLVCILHDHPQFFVDHAAELLRQVPPSAHQIRNIVLSAFPPEQTLFDPFQAGIVLSKIAECGVLPPASAEMGAGVESETAESICQKIRRPGKEGGDRALLEQYTTLLYRAGVVSVRSAETRSKLFDGLYSAAVALPDRQRYYFFSAVLTHIRFPNTHTRLYSEFVFFFFEKTGNEAGKETFVTCLLERLVANRPHPWGILFVFIRLLSSEKYRIQEAPFVRRTEEIHGLFRAITQACFAE
ncbi:MAG: CCR4-NOT transcription complex subunit 1, NOT1, partial [Amphiamblys sp. WSBS2006]